MNKPRFRPDLHVEVVEPDNVFLLSETAYHTLSGRLYAILAPLIDGRHSVEQIARALSPAVSATQVHYALHRLKERGYVIDADLTLPESEAAYWSLHGKTVLTPLYETINVLSIDVADMLTPYVQQAGLHVDAAAPFTLVAVNDYLNPVLADINAAMLRDQRAWMLVKPVGAFLWVGPVFTPASSACWECLAQRLRGNRSVEAFIERTNDLSTPIMLSHAALPTTTGVAAALALQEAYRWLRTGDSSLINRLTVVDPHNFTLTHHALVQRPQCPACGDASLRDPRPITLMSRGKIGTRSAAAVDTLARYQHHVSPITGVVRQLDRVPSLGILHVYAAGANRSRPLRQWAWMRRTLRSHSAGKGTDETSAKVSALCESLERYSGMFDSTEPRIEATFTELGDAAVHPHDLLGFSERQYATRAEWNPTAPPHLEVPAPFTDHKTDWSPVWSLTEARFKFVPTAYCYYGYPLPDDDVFCIPDSNGNAAGSSPEDAIVQGFMELVERDSIALWWYNRARRPCLDLDSLKHPYITQVRDFYAANHRELWVLDLTTDLEIPAFVAISRRVDKPAEDLIMGFGAHFDPIAAALRALTELNQMLPSVLSLDHIGDYYSESSWERRWWTTATLANQPHFVPLDQPMRSVASFQRHDTDDLAEDVRVCERIVREQGLEMLVLDQTRADIGLPVVKVIVPGLRHFWNRFAPGRLYDVPVKLGWLQHPTPETGLNPELMTL